MQEIARAQFCCVQRLTKSSRSLQFSRLTSRLTVGLTSGCGMAGGARILAISDLHVDYRENLQFVQDWSPTEFKNDFLIVAGDVTDNLKLLESTLKDFKRKFAEVFFVPGNHELWIRPKEVVKDSVAKFRKILSLCEILGVQTQPGKVLTSHGPVWIVPLFSWYSTPQEDPVNSLYMRHPLVRDEPNKADRMWMDNHLCKWPKLTSTKSRYFSSLNKMAVNKIYDAPVVSFSHMVPRKDIIPPLPEDHQAVLEERKKNGLGDAPPKLQGATPGFNFTRFAGCNLIEEQVRKIGSAVHIYGHQHRNRNRIMDGIQYISHCLGNVKEQQEGFVYGIADWKGPRQVWPQSPQTKGSE